jgi:hypothetical protein
MERHGGYEDPHATASNDRQAKGSGCQRKPIERHEGDGYPEADTSKVTKAKGNPTPMCKKWTDANAFMSVIEQSQAALLGFLFTFISLVFI